MSSTNYPTSILKSLRLLMPARTLTLDEAKQRAELQATKFLELSGVDQPFVPDEVVTEVPRLRVRYDINLPTSGMTHWDGQAWIVRLNGAEAPMRQRFSLMHEFKHVLDHPFRTLQPGTEFVETVADYFAACVLMPKRWVKTAFFDGVQNVQELARLFAVSPSAMRYRLDQLGLSQPYRCRTVSRLSSAGYLHPTHRLTGATP